MRPGPRYEILNLIVRGDFADVYRAWDRDQGRPIAVKQIHAGLLNASHRLDRYWREMRLWAALEHPNLLTICDLAAPRGRLILEWMDGSLRACGAGKPIEPSALRIVLIGSLHALGCLHSHGILHGDVKPSNLMLGAEHRVKLGDLGLARRVGGQGRSPRGTTKYLAPELVSPEFGAPGPASDLYSLGLSAYESLCGRPLESLLPALGAVGRDRRIAWMTWHSAPDCVLPEIRRVASGVPCDLARVIQTLVNKDPSRRYASAQEALHDLRTAPVTVRACEIVGTGPDQTGRNAEKPRCREVPVRILSLLGVVLVGMVLAMPRQHRTREIPPDTAGLQRQPAAPLPPQGQFRAVPARALPRDEAPVDRDVVSADVRDRRADTRGAAADLAPPEASPSPFESDRRIANPHLPQKPAASTPAVNESSRPDPDRPAISPEVAQAIRVLAAIVRQEDIDLVEADLHIAAAEKLGGISREFDLLRGLLLMKARRPAEADRHFSQLAATDPDLLLPVEALAWLEFEKRACADGIETLERLVRRLATRTGPGDAPSHDATRLLPWIGRLREFTALAVQEAYRAPAAALADLDAAVASQGEQARRLYELGRKEARIALEGFDKGIATSKDAATRSRLRVERRQVRRYATFPFEDWVEQILAGLNRS